MPSSSARQVALSILRTLHEAGHVAYLAGGCVRDALLNIEPKDYDVATDAHPETVRQLFPRSQFVGEAFGVVLVHLRGYSVEVATFRKEWGYADGRRPDQVIFTTAEEDARRRDFTINALFADPQETSDNTPGACASARAHSKIIDYVGGLADLEARVLRAVGNADERFAEDYLRMLRAVRFAARLNFDIEQKTARAIALQAKYLGQISRERIGQEVQWMLAQPDAGKRVHAARWMQQLKLDAAVLNEPSSDAELRILARLADDAAYPTVLAAWLLDRHPGSDGTRNFDAQSLHSFLDRHAPDIVSRWRRALCLSNQSRDQLRDVLNLLARCLDWPALSVAQRKRLLACEAFGQTRRLLEAVDLQPLTQQLLAEAEPLLAEGVAPLPWVTGQDLIDLGLKPSPLFGRLLDEIYDAQLEHRVTTREQAVELLRQRHAERPRGA